MTTEALNDWAMQTPERDVRSPAPRSTASGVESGSRTSEALCVNYFKSKRPFSCLVDSPIFAIRGAVN